MGLFYYLLARFNARSFRWFSRLAICIKLASIFSNFFCVPISRLALFNFPTLCTIFSGDFAFNTNILQRYLIYFNCASFLQLYFKLFLRSLVWVALSKLQLTFESCKLF